METDLCSADMNFEVTVTDGNGTAHLLQKIRGSRVNLISFRCAPIKGPYLLTSEFLEIYSWPLVLGKVQSGILAAQGNYFIVTFMPGDAEKELIKKYIKSGYKRY